MCIAKQIIDKNLWKEDLLGNLLAIKMPVYARIILFVTTWQDEWYLYGKSFLKSVNF